MDAPRLTPPRGHTTRPLTVDDVDDVVALANACELHDVGFPMWDREDLTSDLRLPGVDPARDTIGVWGDDAGLVGWGFLPNGRGAWVDVHPDARRRGIGSWLRAWTEHVARGLGVERVGQTINDRAADATRLLVDAGYTPRRTSWILTMDHAERPVDPTPPDGVTLRAYREGDDVELLTMFEEAFSEFTDRRASSLDAWRVMTIERDGFRPDDLVVAVEGTRIVGGAFLIDSNEIWVDKLAVHREHRHRGIARALLQTAFQRGFDRGYAATSLSTDSNTGALTLYERVGMHVRESYTHLAIDL